MNSAHCVLEYLYRDAGNWKTYGRVLLEGPLPADGADLTRWLESGEYFVPEQVAIPSLHEEHFRTYGGPSDLDHAFHEFLAFRAAVQEEVSSLHRHDTTSRLFSRFRSVGGQWDVSLSANGASFS